MEFIRPLQVFMGMSFREFIPPMTGAAMTRSALGFIGAQPDRTEAKIPDRNNSSIIVNPAITFKRIRQ